MTHAFLREHRDEIVREWESLVTTTLGGVKLADSALRNYIPQFLDELAAWLEHGEEPGTTAMRDAGVRHAVDRLEHSFQLAQLIGEFRLLRTTILRFLLAVDPPGQGLTGTAATVERTVELARLNAGMDFAIGDAVEHFVAQRDRRLEELRNEILSRDIADRKREGERREANALREQLKVTEQLIETESLYMSLFNLTPSGVVLLDEAGYLQAFNNQACRQLGYTREEFARLNVRDIDVAEHAPAELVRHLGRIAEAGGEEIEALHRTKSGSIRSVVVNSRPVEMAGRKHFLAVWQDVTDRKRAEQALEQSERRLRLHVEATPVAVIEYDVRFHITAWNPAAEAIFGWSAEEAMGRRADFIIPESGRPSVDGLWRQMLAEKSSRQNVNENVTKDGRTITCDWNNTVLVSSSGEVIGMASMALDITERNRAEQALRESEERYSRMFRSHVAGFALHEVVCDDKGVAYDYRFLEVNPAFERLTGLVAADIIGRTLMEVLPGAEQVWVERFCRVAQTGVPDHFSSHSAVLNRHFEVTAYPAGARRFAVMFVDITDRQLAEEALQRSEARLRAFVESDVLGILFGDVDGRVYDCNHELARIIGRSREDVLAGKINWVDITPPEDIPLDEVSLAEATEMGRCKPYEKHYLRPNGTAVPVQVGYVLLEPERRKSVAYILDITERKRAEEALQRREAFYRAVLQDSTDFWSVLDADCRYRYLSSGASSVVGWTEQDLLGHHALERVHPDDADRVRLGFDAMLAAPERVGRDTYRFRHKDGTWRVLDVVARNLLTDPDVRGIVVNRRDVTHQIKLEEQFRQAQKLESIGRLAGGIAHDFNNLLTVILSCAEALDDDARAGRPSNPEEIGEIRGAGKRAGELTRQLLTFARKQVIAPVPLDLNALVRESETLLGRVLGEDVVLGVSLQPTAWAIRSDRGQIEQVILNLAVNARDAMPNGGRLTIDTTNVQVDESMVALHPFMRTGPHVRLRVIDSGVGMTADVKAHAFEPFFTTKPQGKGTGLGLATVYGIVKQSDGYILLESEPDRGTTFELFFPRVFEAVAQEPPSAVTTSRGTETVLVVEDDAQVREVALRSLRGVGYRVIVASSGREALDLAEQEAGPLHLLVTDVIMPGLRGPEVANELRRRQPDLRVLYVSGYSQESIARGGVLDPGVELLQKPFTGSELRERVRKVLDSH